MREQRFVGASTGLKDLAIEDANEGDVDVVNGLALWNGIEEAVSAIVPKVRVTAGVALDLSAHGAETARLAAPCPQERCGDVAR
jgi:hypothetical protein